MNLVPLSGKQRQAVQLSPGHRTVAYEGSVRSSKTITSLVDWLTYVRRGPAGNLAMIAKTERTLKRNIVDVLIDMVGEKRCKANWGDGELTLLGRKIYMAGANNVQAEGRIRGLTLAGAYVDEATLLGESYWAMLRTRLSVEGAQLFATMNPDNPNHFMMRDNLKHARTWLKHDGTVVTNDAADAMNIVRLSFRLRDNPSLSEEYIRSLEREFTGLWRKRFVEGLWVLAEGAIFDSFDSTSPKQVLADVPRFLQRLTLAVDYGTTNSFVAVLAGIGTGPDGRERIYVLKEWRWDSRKAGHQLTDAEYSRRLRTWLGPLEQRIDHIVVDPSAASFIAQLYKDDWQGIRKANNAVLDGIRSVSSLFAADRLVIHQSCGTGHREEGGSENAGIDELTGYVWDDDAAKRGDEKPVKTDDHFPDALRYLIMEWSLRSTWRNWLTELVLTDTEDEAA